MSTSAANVATGKARRARKAVGHRKFNDGLDTYQFKQKVAEAHRAFFLKRGIDTEVGRMDLRAMLRAIGLYANASGETRRGE